MFKPFKTVYTASVFTALMLLMPSSQAADFNYTFGGTVDSGLLLNETFSGSFSYSDLLLTHSGDESINLSTLSFNFLSTPFGLGDADITASADFLDGVFLGVNFSVGGFDPAFALVSGYGIGLLEAAYFSYDTLSGDSGLGSISYQQSNSVDEPVSIALFGMGLAGLGLSRRRAKNGWGQ
ncbi:PEP-CTERM domain protein [Methylovulum miyakonense]|uniref:PEP-CTERM domain protein n=1 Tax=Methylovulum miyakonense TaxID=645578 RepID=UPI00036F2E5A|nr:PEP-CTERM domain protein [Methylovulum miyakonense]